MAKHRRKRLAQAPQDRELWQKLYYTHQKSYQRQRLLAIKHLWDGLKMIEVCERLDCTMGTLRIWVDLYLSGGFDLLLQPKKSGRKGTGRLSAKRLKVLKFIILYKTPSDYDLPGYVWTLDLLEQLLLDKWNIVLKKSRLAVILEEKLNLSYQQFHRDYQNANKGKQIAFVQDLQQRIDNQDSEEAIVWFDEFSASTRPQASRAWAEKNTSPIIPSDEKKENALMLC